MIFNRCAYNVPEYIKLVSSTTIPTWLLLRLISICGLVSCAVVYLYKYCHSSSFVFFKQPNFTMYQQDSDLQEPYHSRQFRNWALGNQLSKLNIFTCRRPLLMSSNMIMSHGNIFFNIDPQWGESICHRWIPPQNPIMSFLLLLTSTNRWQIIWLPVFSRPWCCSNDTVITMTS